MAMEGQLAGGYIHFYNLMKLYNSSGEQLSQLI